MNAVVIGGHTRNIGKTSVMTGLLRDLAPLGWTAVKITQYGHGICSRDGESCGCAPEDHPFVLSEERDARGRADTCRYLAAGARRSLWLRVRQGQLGQAYPLLEESWKSDAWVMVESNSILEFLRPLLYLVVLDDSVSDFKASARRFLGQADALVTISPRGHSPAWDGIEAATLARQPVFPVKPRCYSSPELLGFVRERLGCADVWTETQGRFSNGRIAPLTCAGRRLP